MAVFNGSNTNPNTLINQVTNKLVVLRNAMDAITDLYGWSSGVAASDLEAIGMAAGDASALLTAIADANAVAQIYDTGLPPGSYPQPSSAYVYAASQRQVMGTS